MIFVNATGKGSQSSFFNIHPKLVLLPNYKTNFERWCVRKKNLPLQLHFLEKIPSDPLILIGTVLVAYPYPYNLQSPMQ